MKNPSIYKIAFIFLFLFAYYSSQAQSVDNFFAFLPERYLSQIGLDQRLDLLNRKDSAVLNNYGGKSKLLVFDSANNYIKVQTSEQGFLEVKKWALRDSIPLFAVSFWVCSPACDGGIHFFRSNYVPVAIDKGYFPEITVTDFFDKDSLLAKGISEEEFKNRFDIFFLRFEFQQAGNDIIAINDNENYMNKEDYEKWKACLLGKRLPLKWENGHFEKGKAYFKE